MVEQKAELNAAASLCRIASRMPFNMARHCVGEAAHWTPEKTALLVIADVAADAPTETWTYAALEDAVLRIAGGLRAMGLAPGDRLMIRLDNTSAYALLFFGAVAAGVVALPTSFQLTETEALFLARDCSAAAIATAASLDTASLAHAPILITPDDVARMIREAPRARYAATHAGDPAFLIYTSGTTARPKGVLHAQRSVLGRRPMYDGWYGMTAADRVLHAGAFNWTFTLGTGLTDPWANGATAIVFTGEKEPALWPHLIAKTDATIFAGVPGLLRQILKYASPTAGHMPTLRHALMAGETPPPGLFEDWAHETGTEIYEGFGMSEISTYISSSPTVPRRPGTAGKPQPGRRVEILSADGSDDPLPPGAEGLIAVHRSDPGLMLGYWNRPQEEAEVLRGQWFTGGDLGIMDADGYITYAGRNNDLMKALGYRVSPLEVEAVLAGHPAVAEVACAEIAVREGVHVIGAFIVPRHQAPINPAEIKAFAAERLAAYKCPREVRFLDQLPRTANGKVKRSALLAAAPLETPAGLAERGQNS
jgi:acyl-coenzyme A synthetase/AMP-(fatty) acid ligase